MISVRRFQLPDGGTFEIPEEWLAEARILGFEPTAPSYRPRTRFKGTLLAIKDIAPPSMAGRQHLDFGGFDHDRMIRILRAIVQDRPMPPVEVVRELEGRFPYSLYHGAHRYHASVAVGFPLVPVLVRKRWVPEVEAVVP